MPERCKKGFHRNKVSGECVEVGTGTKNIIKNANVLRRCEKGSRRNRTTGECEKVGQNVALMHMDLEVTATQKRCPRGTRRNRKTGLCEESKTRNNKPKHKSPTLRSNSRSSTSRAATASPHVSTPHVSTPHVASASPHVASASPHVSTASPHVSTPHVSTPHVSTPHVSTPHVATASPHVSTPHVSTPTPSNKPPMIYMGFQSNSALLIPNKKTKKRLFDLPEDAMRRLSNFSSDAVEYKGHRYPTIEHAYQAHKYNYTSKPEIIAEFYVGGKIKTAKEAKKAGGKEAMKKMKTALDIKRWEPTSDKVMEDLVKYKVQNYPEIRNILSILRKNNVYLVHTSRGDKNWGASMNDTKTGIKLGKNKLGKLYNTIPL